MSEDFKSAARAQAKGDLARAKDMYQRLLDNGDKNRAAIFSNLSVMALLDGNATRAEELARRGLDEAPTANVWNNLGLALKAQGRSEEARDAFEAAVKIDPMHAEAWSNLAGLLALEKRHEDALRAIDRALAADPSSNAALEIALYLRADTLSWAKLDSLIAKAQAHVQAGAPISPYALVTICHDPAELLRAAYNKAGNYQQQVTPKIPVCNWDGRRKIRLGYFSSSLRAHATGYLLRQVIAAHDRSRFKLQAFVYGEPKMTDTEAEFSRTLRSPFETVVDLSQLTDLDAAKEIRSRSPDIVLDIDGYANGGRPGVLAHRPAPLQIAWLGHLCSMGASFIDAMLADEHSIPTQDDRHYAEKILRLPDGFFPGDGAREVSDRFTNRSDLGLPETGPILCAFNQARKITPPVLDAWAVILNAVPDATLWLWSVNPVAEANLSKELNARGVSGRYVFAQSVPSPDHLCRYRFIDLVLDTWPFNGHTMTSDALYMGVPVVTLRGRTFPSRVAASLVARLGLANALVADDLKTYCAHAIRIALDPKERASLHQTIKTRAPDALFNSVRFTRGLELLLERVVRSSDFGR